MSLCMQVYVTDIDDVESLVGSNDPAHLEAAARLRDRSDPWDEVTTPAAAKAVVLGGPFPGEPHHYAYGYLGLVEEYEWTTRERNDHFCPMNSDYFFAADQAMAALGFRAARLFDLFGGSLPQPLVPTDQPNYGTWSHQTCKALTAEAERIEIGAAPAEYRPAIEQALAWARSAARFPRFGVMAFTA